MINNIFGKHGNRSSDFLEEMSSPNNFTSFGGHVTNNRWIGFLVGEDSLNLIEFSSIIV